MISDSDSKPSDALIHFSNIDDSDIMIAAKMWCQHDDLVLSKFAQMIVNRKLLRVELRSKPFDTDKINSIKQQVLTSHPIYANCIDYFVFSDSVSNNTYSSHDDSIKILYNNGDLIDIAEASDILNTKALSAEVKKYLLCYPK
jgi:uncharacterized protein